MHLWELLGIVGIAFLIIEMFTPTMFFMNFSVAAFITAVLSVFTKNPYALVLTFFVFSFVSFIFLRPILIKRFCKTKETGLENKYIGKIAKAEEEISEFKGVITIYGERWEARSEHKTVIPKDSEVKIVRNESIIMYVEEVQSV